MNNTAAVAAAASAAFAASASDSSHPFQNFLCTRVFFFFLGALPKNLQKERAIFGIDFRKNVKF